MEEKKRGRRRFLRGGLVALATGMGGTLSSGAAAAAGAEVVAAYGRRSSFVVSGRVAQPSGPNQRPDLLTPLQDSLGTITPSGLHYEVSHGSNPPGLDPSIHQLALEGLVDGPRFFSMEELERMPSRSCVHLLECAGNTAPPLWLGRAHQTAQLTHGLTSCSEWTGVPLAVLLEQVTVQREAKWLVAEGAEARHVRSLPLGKGLRDVLVAYGQNGEPLRPENGFPLRLVVPGLGGFYSVKWLRRLRLTAEPHRVPGFHHGHHQESVGLELGPKSIITFPSGEQRLPGPGFFMVSGLAWSGSGPIARVEISTDGGLHWREAQLETPVLPVAHTLFRIPWTWDGTAVVLQSRCTDRRGRVQPTLGEFANRLGLTPQGLSRPAIRIGHFNAIHSWRVDGEGKVHSALTPEL